MAKDSVVGLADYFNGTDKDFSKVGVKALDDYTLQYTLKQPEPYWNSKMTYSLFWPVNEEFLKSKGDSFGKSTDPSSILYNGPYILKSLTAKSSIELAKMKTTGIRKMSTSMALNFLSMMHQTKNRLFVISLMALIVKHVYIQQAQTLIL